MNKNKLTCVLPFNYFINVQRTEKGNQDQFEMKFCFQDVILFSRKRGAF